MPNLTEATTYEAGIYQLETTDPVLAGAGGISNLQAQQLANRTNWLAAQLAAAGGGAGSSWDLVLDLPGTSLAPFVQLSGVWEILNGVIRQSATTATSHWLRTVASYPGSLGYLMEAEVQVPGAPAGDLYAGIIAQQTPAGSNGGPAFRLERIGGVYRVQALREGTALIATAPFAWTLNAWFTVRVLFWGGRMLCYVNGALLIDASASFGDLTAYKHPSLLTYGTIADFRNVRAWAFGNLPV
jgi:hypothetical protein